MGFLHSGETQSPILTGGAFAFPAISGQRAWHIPRLACTPSCAGTLPIDDCSLLFIHPLRRVFYLVVMMARVIDQKNLVDMFEYDKATGHLIWRERFGCTSFNKRMAGRVAGTVKEKDGWLYRQICISGKTFLAHRLVWMYHFSDAPPVIDHINRNSLDNRIENLRVSDRQLNRINSVKAHPSNLIGIKGIRAVPGGYAAFSYVNKKIKRIGTFKTIHDASVALEKYIMGIFGEHAPLNG